MSAHRALGRAGLAGEFNLQIGLSKKVAHPHNFILELWVNVGATEILLFSLVFIAISQVAKKLNRLNQSVLLQTVTAWYVVSLTGHSFTQSCWIATTAITAVALAKGFQSHIMPNYGNVFPGWGKNHQRE